MKKKFIIITAVSFLLLVFIPPLSLLLGPTTLREYANRELVYKVIADKVTRNATNEREKALRLFNYLHYHIHTPMRSRVSDVNQLHHLVRNVAWCDSQAGTLVALARKINLKGGWVALHGYDERSHHSTSVLYIDGKYRMLDPFYGYVFMTKDNDIATLEDIRTSQTMLSSEQYKAMQMIGSERLNKTLGIDRLEFYFKLYEPAYSWKIHMLQWSGFKRKLVSMIVDTYYDVFGDIFLVPFQEMYFRVADTEPFLKARLKHLSLRLKSAIKDYDDIIKNEDLVKDSEILLIDYKDISTDIIRSEMMFFKGQALWDMKDFNKCIEAFKELLKAYSDTRWLGLAYFYLGNCYENLLEIDKAKYIYSKITTDITTNFTDKEVSQYLNNNIESTPAAIHLMHLLKQGSLKRHKN
jgi:tetratricopeptide (TPR) repeat protein